MLALLLVALTAALGAEAAPAAKAAQDVPRILLDQSPRAIEYQLARLTNDQLARAERHDTDVKYRPIYVAILTRKGMARPLRDEALAAIVKMDRATPTQVLLDAMAKVPAEEADGANGDSLLAMLLGQLPAACRISDPSRFGRRCSSRSRRCSPRRKIHACAPPP
jgi:hypothetical protein